MSLFGPVLTREMEMLARAKRQFFFRALYLGGMILSVLFFEDDIGPYDLPTIGAMLFNILAWAQLIALILLTPLLTAPVVASEKEGDTLGLLLMTPLRPAQILFNKLASRLVVLVLFLLSGLPVFIILLTFGGVEPATILWTYIHIFSALVLCCGIGLLASVWAQTTAGALASAYGCLVVMGVVLFLIESLSMSVSGVFPLSFLVETTQSMIVWQQSGQASGQSLRLPWSFPILAWLIFLFALRRSLTLLPRVALQPRQSRLWAGLQRLNRFLERINYTRIHVLRESVPIGDNPVMWLETSKRLVCSRSFRLRFVYILVFVFFLLSILWVEPAGAVLYADLHVGLTLLMALGLAAGAFVRENDQVTHGLMLMTPLSGREWLVAKVVGVTTALMPLVLVPLIMPIPAIFLGAWKTQEYVWAQYGRYILALLFTLPMTVVIGLVSGLVGRTMRQALLHAFAWFAVWNALPWVLIYIPILTWEIFLHVHDRVNPLSMLVASILAPPTFWTFCADHMSDFFDFLVSYYPASLGLGYPFILLIYAVISVLLAMMSWGLLWMRSNQLYRRPREGGRP